MTLRKGWHLLPLQSVCAVNPKIGDDVPQPDTLVSFVPMAAVAEQGGGIIQAETRPYGEVAKGYTYFRENDVLFAKITPCMENGKITIARGLANGIGFGSTEFHVIRCGPDVLPEWVFAFVSQPAFRAAAKESFTGTAGQQRVPADFVKNSAIPLPPLPEQERLVRLLDEADALRRLRARADARMADFIPALFHEIFGDPAKDNWSVKTLMELCSNPDDIKCGPFGTQLMSGEYVMSGVPLWSIRHVNLHFTIATDQFLTPEKARELDAYSLIPGDIVMTRKATVGNCTVYPSGFERGIMHSDLLRIRVNANFCTPDYLSAQLAFSDEVKHQIGTVSSGATTQGINVGKLKRISVHLPPFSFQREFAVRVSEARALEEKQVQSKARLDALFESMLARAFAGEL